LKPKKKESNLDLKNQLKSILDDLEGKLCALLYQGRTTRCDLYVNEIGILELVLKNSDVDRQKLSDIFLALVSVVFLDCVCEALLVPCPSVEEETGVVLAKLTVKDNQVMKICNTVRRQIPTNHAVRYWTEPSFTFLEGLMATLCCQPIVGRRLEEEGEPLVDAMPATLLSRFGNLGALPTLLVNNLPSNLGKLFNPNMVSLLDVYDQPVDDAVNLLENRGIRIADRQSGGSGEDSSEDARSGQMKWVVEPGSTVELVLSDNQRVMGMRVVAELDESEAND
jgi:hypothetical protein